MRIVTRTLYPVECRDHGPTPLMTYLLRVDVDASPLAVSGLPMARRPQPLCFRIRKVANEEGEREALASSLSG